MAISKVRKDRPVTHKTLTARLLCMLMLQGACSDSSGPGQGPVLPPSGALVSSVVHPAAASNAAVVSGQAYVSMVPGTDADGRRVDIRNLRSGASATSPMTNGGFDPVAVQAEVGDSLSITVIHHAGDDTTSYREVPIKAKPTIVRSSPGMGKTDVPLNSVIRVVFNQPMDGASLSQALHLRQGGAEVPGSITGELSGGVILSARFVPAGLLAPLSSYELSVSTAAQSPDGEPLDAPLTVAFTTGPSAGAARLRVVHAETRVGDMDVLIDGIKVVSDLRYATATDYRELAAGYHEVWYQVNAGTMDESVGIFTAGVDYTVLPCCELFPLGGFLLTDDNSEPAAGNARIRVIDYATVESSVRVYLTSPEADLATEEPIATMNILDATQYVEVPAGDYRIRFTRWDSDFVVMDSGTLTFGPGQVRTVVGIDASTGGAPWDWLVLEDLN